MNDAQPFSSVPNEHVQRFLLQIRRLVRKDIELLGWKGVGINVFLRQKTYRNLPSSGSFLLRDIENSMRGFTVDSVFANGFRMTIHASTSSCLDAIRMLSVRWDGTRHIRSISLGSLLLLAALGW
jgi:hypothetical protein